MKRLFVVLLVLIASVSWAADVKISNLPEATTLADTDVFPVVAGSTTSKVQVTNLKTILATHDAITLSTNLGTNLLGLSTQQLTLDNQTANYVFAGPTTGSAAAPSFRALVAADIPSLVATYQPLNATLTALAAQTETEGSIQYYTAAATPAVLAKGTAYQLLNMNSGATAPAWTSTLGATGTRLTKIWATDLEVTNAPTVNGAALTTILQPLNDDLTTLAGGGTANCIWGEKSDASGIECKTSINIQMDDSAAQFKSATASKGTMKFVQTGISDGKLLTQTWTAADDYTFTPTITGNTTITFPTSGTLQTVKAEKLAVFTWDGNGTALTAAEGTKRCAFVPAASTLTGLYASSQAEPTSNITIALYKDAFSAAGHATTAMISGTNAVVIPSAGSVMNVNDTTLTGFTTAISAGDQICATITATDTTTWLQLTLYGTK